MAAKNKSTTTDTTVTKTFSVNMTFKKSTKGTHVYDDDADDPAIPVLYIRRTALGDEPPKAITVVVTEVTAAE